MQQEIPKFGSQEHFIYVIISYIGFSVHSELSLLPPVTHLTAEEQEAVGGRERNPTFQGRHAIK